MRSRVGRIRVGDVFLPVLETVAIGIVVRVCGGAAEVLDFPPIRQTVTVRVPSSPAFGRAPACKLPRLHVGTPVTQGIVATSGTEVTVGVRVDAPARVGLLIEDFVVPHRFRVYLTSRNMVTGSGTIAWNGRIAGAPLWPGSYLLVLRGARGCRRATPVAVPLEVTRPPRP